MNYNATSYLQNQTTSHEIINNFLKFITVGTEYETCETLAQKLFEINFVVFVEGLFYGQRRLTFGM